MKSLKWQIRVAIYWTISSIFLISTSICEENLSLFWFAIGLMISPWLIVIDHKYGIEEKKELIHVCPKCGYSIKCQDKETLIYANNNINCKIEEKDE